MEQDKNRIGRIYGSRISRNGKWLNLIIAIDKEKFNVPISLEIPDEDGKSKPYASVEKGSKNDGAKVRYNKAVIYGIPIYMDETKEETPKPPINEEFPFWY